MKIVSMQTYIVGRRCHRLGRTIVEGKAHTCRGSGRLSVRLPNWSKTPLTIEHHWQILSMGGF